MGWKHVKTLIHPPLPLSTPESRHLLSLLNTSFTEALDKEHPKVSSEGRNTTDEHVHSILSSPIFGPKPSEHTGRPDYSPPFKKHTRTTATESPKSTIHGPLESISIANAMVEANVNSFKNHILTGKANLSRATACLQNSNLSLKWIGKNYHAEAFKGFGKHGVASMMLNWLWSSGLEKSDEVLLHTRFLPLLSPFLVIEGRLEEAMQWFQRLGAKAALYSGDAPFPMAGTLAICLENAERSQERLLASLLSWDRWHGLQELSGVFEPYKQLALRDGYLSNWPGISLRRRQQAMLHALVFYAFVQDSDKSLNTAISIFVQAMTLSNVADVSPMELTSVFHDVGDLIVRQIQRGWKADQPGYNAFSSTVPFWNNTNDLVRHNLVRSILKLHHPNNPDWEPAYLFLSNLTPTIVKESTLWERRRTVSLGLDTARMLLSDGKPPHARRAKRIMEGLQQYFGDELGMLSKSREEARERHFFGHYEQGFALAI